jgi:hypothetical protein
MAETTNTCEDRCIEAGNLEKAIYYKWLRVDLWQRGVTLIESAKIG